MCVCGCVNMQLNYLSVLSKKGGQKVINSNFSVFTARTLKLANQLPQWVMGIMYSNLHHPYMVKPTSYRQNVPNIIHIIWQNSQLQKVDWRTQVIIIYFPNLNTYTLHRIPLEKDLTDKMNNYDIALLSWTRILN